MEPLSPWAGQWLEAQDRLIRLITLSALTLHLQSPGQCHGQTLREMPAHPMTSQHPCSYQVAQSLEMDFATVPSKCKLHSLHNRHKCPLTSSLRSKRDDIPYYRAACV